MPVPTPKTREAKERFIVRCLDTLTEDEKGRFSSVSSAAAVCFSEWDRHVNDNMSE